MISLYLRANRQIPGLGYWTLNIGLQGITPILLLANALAYPIIIYGGFALLTFLGGIFFYFGLSEFTQTTIRKGYCYTLFFLLFLLVLLSFFLSWQNSVRYILVSTGCVVLAACYIHVLVRNIHTHHAYRTSFLMLTFLYVVFGLFHLIRIVYLLERAGDQTNDLIRDAPYFLYTQLFTFSFLLAVNLIILLLISQKLVHDLFCEAKQKTLLLDKLRILAEKDGLTGLLNRSTMEAYLNGLFSLPTDERKNTLLSFIDVDHFKQVNDKYGHEVGDKVLRELASLLQRHAQGDDRVCRWGGDEFLIILHRSPETPIQACAEVLVKDVWTHDWEPAIGIEGLQISISCGYTNLGSAESKRDLLREVDQNLYAAKGKGRNRAVGK